MDNSTNESVFRPRLEKRLNKTVAVFAFFSACFIIITATWFNKLLTEKRYTQFILDNLQTIAELEANLIKNRLLINPGSSISDIASIIHVGRKGYSWVINKDRIMVSHPNQEYIGKDVMEIRRSIFPERNWSDLESIIERMIDGQKGIGVYTSMWLTEDKQEIAKKLVGFAPIQLDGEFFSVGINMDYSEIANLTKTQTVADSIITTMVILIFVVFVFYYYYLHLHKESLNELQVSEIRFRKLSDAAFEGIAIHENQRIFDCNNKLIEMFGYALDELNNMNGIELIAPDLRETVKGYIDAGYEGPYEAIGFKKDGSIFPVEIQAREMQLHGHVYRVVAVRDISLQKHLEEESEIYKERIFKAQKHTYVNAMSAIVAHQLNQPLTTINMLLDKVLEMESDKNQCCPSVLEKIERCLKEAQRAASIIRDFRQYSKIPAFEATGTVSLSDTANRVITLISQKAKRARMNISVKALDNLPGLEFNETALEQIFLIIIQNAIEAADGKKQHKLDIVGNLTDDTVELQFSDDCCGIVPENLDKIFEPFFSTKSEDKGMGLGLDIVQQILISCGGEVRVESELGKGASFYITLPVGQIRKL